MSAIPAALPAQRLQPEVRFGFLASTTLVEDLVAVPALLQQYGQGGESPRAWASPAPLLSLGGRLPLRERVSLSGLVGWQPTQLRVEDAGGERDVQSVDVLHGLLEVGVRPVPVPVEVSAGIGVLGYRADGRGLFAGGTDVSPLARMGAGVGLRPAGHALTVRALAEYHRFGSAALRASGAQAGSVIRYGAELALAWGGAR